MLVVQRKQNSKIRKGIPKHDFMKHLSKHETNKLQRRNESRPLSNADSKGGILEGREIALNKTADINKIAKKMNSIQIAEDFPPISDGGKSNKG